MAGAHESPNLPSIRAAAQERLDSWKEIAAYLGRSVRTVVRWEAEDGLPVHRLVHHERSSVYALKPELDEWMQSRSSISVQPAAGEGGSRLRGGLTILSWVGGLSIMAAIGAMLSWKSNPTPMLAARPLTSMAGAEVCPSFSPDGERIAFSWEGEGQDNFDIYSKAVEGHDKPLRLTRHPGIDTAPAWSPDGKRIAFLRFDRQQDGGTYELVVMPSAGGDESPLTTLRVAATHPISSPPAIYWTPDSNHLIAPQSPGAGGPAALLLIDANSGVSRPLTTAPEPGARDHCGTISPDGRFLAFLRKRGQNHVGLHLLRLAGKYAPAGTPRLVLNLQRPVHGLRWTRDGRSLLFTAWLGETSEVWRTSLDSPEKPRLITAIGRTAAGSVSFSDDADKVAYGDYASDSDIWLMEFSGSAGNRTSPLIRSSHADSSPAVSPDGERIAFASGRSGSPEIWLCDRDGSSETQLTRGFQSVGMPRWSPDGVRIAFNALTGNNWDIYLLNASGGHPTRLTADPAVDINPSWSNDGKTIYFSSNRSGTQQIWRIPVRAGERPGSSTSTATAVTTRGGWRALEALDGVTVYYAKSFMSTSIWRVPSWGGEEVQVTDSLNLLHNFDVTRHGIYYQAGGILEPRFSIWFLPFASSNAQLVANLSNQASGGMAATAESSGRRGRIIFSVMEGRGGDLWLVEGLR